MSFVGALSSEDGISTTGSGSKAPSQLLERMNTKIVPTSGSHPATRVWDQDRSAKYSTAPIRLSGVDVQITPLVSMTTQTIDSVSTW